MSWQLWGAFVAACLVISVTPGPGAVVSMSVGLQHGYLAALRAIAGLQAALMIQLAIVAAGLGAVLAASATAFLVLKLAGAAYLVWLGIQKWRAPAAAPGAPVLTVRPQPLFRTGLLVNLSNPKAIIFVAALVPQFFRPEASALLQFAIIGATMMTVDVLVMSVYAVLAARFRPWLGDPRAQRVQNRVVGGLFVGAGVALASTSRS
ncbi:MAG: LysE family transporter [Rhodocyclaceae bacterium]|nr:LysE family transporter [Rhodocyclaceae bacterium]